MRGPTRTRPRGTRRTTVTGRAGHTFRCVLALLALLLVAGCGGLGQRRTAAENAAARFEQALRSRDGAAACAALAPGTRDELVQSAGTSCPRAVLEEAAAPAGPRQVVRRADVHGRQARVVLAGDTLFLSLFGTGWKVTAAGCTPRPGQPYGCAVQGG